MLIYLNHLKTPEKLEGIGREITDFGKIYGREWEPRFLPDKKNPTGIAILGDTIGTHDDALPYFSNFDFYCFDNFYYNKNNTIKENNKKQKK